MAGKKFVKCKNTGESIDKNYAFSIILSGHKRASYFKSEEDYEQYSKKLKVEEDEKDLWKKCNDIVVNLIPKQDTEKYPPKLFKVINDIRKEYSTSFLFYLLNFKNLKESFSLFKRNNPKSSLDYKINVFLKLIRKEENNAFQMYLKNISGGTPSNPSENFSRNQKTKTENVAFLKYLEEE